MLHTIIVRDNAIFQLMCTQTGAKKIPSSHALYSIYAIGNTRLIGLYDITLQEVLVSLVSELNPDTIFFLSESYPVSDEKLSGDIILPNVFFHHNKEIETMELHKNMGDSMAINPIFLEHYSLQGDYNFESFGLSVGGIHVSGEWNREQEDFRIRLRVVYENDTFDPCLAFFVETAKKLSIIEKAYPIAYVASGDVATNTKNLWSIVGFIIGSIDPDMISTEQEDVTDDDTDDEWIDRNERE